MTVEQDAADAGDMDGVAQGGGLVCTDDYMHK